MRINISVAENNDLYITLTTWAGEIIFSYGFEDEIEAKLICESLEDKFKNRIREIRRAAYNQGRRSARDKTKKCEEFYGCINNHEVGW